MKQVVITGLGAISPAGMTVERLFNSCIKGKSNLSSFSLRGESIPIAAILDDEPFINSAKNSRARCTNLALLSAEQAWGQAKLSTNKEIGSRGGVFWGTAMGGATSIELDYIDYYVHKKRLRPLSVVKNMANAAPALLSMAYGLKGPSYNFSTACSSSANAIGCAYNSIRYGEIDLAISGGAEACLTEAIISSWKTLGTLAKIEDDNQNECYRPFSHNRTGLVLGEGAGTLILEEKKCAIDRGVKILGEIVGYGTSSDAIHITKPDASGQITAMENALKSAELSPSDIGYINAHGTATLHGDIIETSAIKTVFGDYAYQVPVSSTKAVHGHLLGAAGAIELIIALSAMLHKTIPPTANYQKKDADCDLDYVVDGFRKCQSLNYVMSNSFAFGGNNVSLIIKR